MSDKYFCKYALIIGGAGGWLCAYGIDVVFLYRIFADKRGSYFRTHFEDKDFLKIYISPMYHKNKNNILTEPLHRCANDNKETEKIAACLTGTKEELENWKHFVFNNKLPLFISIVMTINQSNNVLDYVPWLTDRHYTDEEIAKLFNFTEEEVDFIELTLAKYERHADFYTRLATGRPNK